MQNAAKIILFVKTILIVVMSTIDFQKNNVAVIGREWPKKAYSLPAALRNEFSESLNVSIENKQYRCTDTVYHSDIINYKQLSLKIYIAYCRMFKGLFYVMYMERS